MTRGPKKVTESPILGDRRVTPLKWLPKLDTEGLYDVGIIRHEWS